MKKLMLFAVGSVCFVGASAAAKADAPMVFKTCAGVTPTAKQGLLLFDDKCKSAYLLPGSEGQLNVTGAFFTYSDQACEAVQAMETAVLGTFGGAAERASKKKELEKNLKVLQDKIAEVSQELGNLNLARGAFSTNQQSTQAALSSARSAFERKCNQDPNKSLECLSLSNDVIKLDAKDVELTGKMSKLDKIISIQSGDLDAARAQELTVLSAIKALRPEATPKELSNEARTQLDEMRKQQGAVVSVTLKTGLSDDLRRVRQLNAANPINIDQMRFASGSIYISGKREIGAPDLIGNVDIQMPGEVVTGGGVLFINAAGVKLTLDTVAACQAFNYKRPSSTNLPLVTQNLAANVVAKAYLRYNALVGVTVTVDFNYDKFYELLVSTESRNGFFRTSTVKNVAETLKGQSSLNVQIVDEGKILSQDAKNAIQTTMTNRVIQQALDLLNAKYVGIDPAANATVPTAGAPVAADALRKCTNKWCQAGAAVIDVAHAIFGGSDSRQKFVQQHGVKSSETYNNQEIFEFTTDLTFSAK